MGETNRAILLLTESLSSVMIGPVIRMTLNMCKVLKILLSCQCLSWRNFKTSYIVQAILKNSGYLGNFLLQILGVQDWRLHSDMQSDVFSNKCVSLSSWILKPKLLMFWLIYFCCLVFDFLLPFPFSFGRVKIKPSLF